MKFSNQILCKLFLVFLAVFAATCCLSSEAFAADPTDPDGALCVYEYPGDKLISTGCKEDDYTGWFDFTDAGIGAGIGLVVGIITCCGPIGIAAGIIGAFISALSGGGNDVTLCPPNGSQSLSHYYCKLDKVTGQLDCEVDFDGNLKPDTMGVQISAPGVDTTGYVLVDMTSATSPIFKLYYSPQRKSSGQLTEIFPDDVLVSSTGDVSNIFDIAKVYDPTTTKRVVRFSFDLDDAKKPNGQSLNFGYSNGGIVFSLTTRGKVIGWGLAYSGVKVYNGPANKCSAEYQCEDRVGQAFEIGSDGNLVSFGDITAGNQPWSSVFTLTGNNLKVLSTSSPADADLKTPAKLPNGTHNLKSESKVIVVDNANGGMATFTFKEPYAVDQISLLNLKTATTVMGFDGPDGTGNMLFNFKVPLAGSKPANSLIDFQPNTFGAPVNLRLVKVKSLKVTSGNRFGITQINYCPQTCVKDSCGVCNGGDKDKGCDGVCFSGKVKDDCGVCGGMNMSKDCAGVCGGTAKYDCAGVCNGNAKKDCLGVCKGTAMPGCDGVCNSGKVEDACWICGGPGKDICGKCPGQPGYNPTNMNPAYCTCPQGYDSCGVCGGGDRDKDCAGVCFGTAKKDCLGVCKGTAVKDCNNVCNGNSTYDCKGVCGGSSTYDCAGVCGGYAVKDCLGVCKGTATYDCLGICNGNAVKDCNNVCNGTSVKDCAGVCNGTAVKDCAGVCKGTATKDCLGVCKGTASKDCAGVCNGNATRDCKNVCNGPAAPDCLGICDGTATHDPENVCCLPEAIVCNVCFGKKDICERCPGTPGYDPDLKDPKLCDCPQGVDECGVCGGPGKDVCGVCGGKETDPKKCSNNCKDQNIATIQGGLDGNAFLQKGFLGDVTSANIRLVKAQKGGKKKGTLDDIAASRAEGSDLYQANWHISYTELAEIQTICPETNTCVKVDNTPALTDYVSNSEQFRQLILKEIDRYKKLIKKAGKGNRKRRVKQWTTKNTNLHEESIDLTKQVPASSSDC